MVGCFQMIQCIWNRNAWISAKLLNDYRYFYTVLKFISKLLIKLEFIW